MTESLSLPESWAVHQGDCLALLPTLEAGSVDMVLTDLPYGTTASAWDTVIPFAPLWEAYRRVIKPGGAIVLTAAQPFTSALVMSNPAWFRYEWIWEKPQGTGHLNAEKMPLRNHESVLVFADRLPHYYPQMSPGRPYPVHGTGKDSLGTPYGKHLDVHNANSGTRHPKSVLRFAQERTGLHPNQKPVGLFAYFIRTYTLPGELVLDSCAGSCSSGVACIQEGRRFIGIELSPEYVAVSRERLARAAAQGLLPFEEVLDA